ncbi:exodeoxyribonuclease VII small subunit [Aureimonas fodinaquatilis]|uniref:Exodeoxyribonuclease 7 small subunit n=1 Tax=Aureimonas fodinaquatilis TaxID=2565783 RepID=A0A5B0E3B7_9HYPH|nr:exodeoxyribonuclease VII small subunit [Aureimonas fodinaquatilis]KAA0972471.1 exodeoxyribonuclease VII small subunit [Aureimonas fodinaquatilis]
MSDNTIAIPADDSDIAQLSFEAALAALEKIVSDLERGNVPLETAIRIYERGEKLKAHSEKLLTAAEDKVEKIKLARGKPVGTEPLDPA